MSASVSARVRRAMRATEAELETDEERAELDRLLRRVKPRAERRRRDTGDMLKAIASMIRAHGVRVGDGDETDLGELDGLHVVIEEAKLAAVYGQRTQLDRGVSNTNASWQHIANAFGITRAGAFNRYAEPVRELAEKRGAA